MINSPETLTATIPELLDNHPCYIQYLAHHVWSSTEKEITEDSVETAVSSLPDQNNYLFQLQTDNLTNTQVAFLNALCEGVVSFTSMDTMKKYDLGSFSNIRRIKDALIQKEIIDIFPGKPEFLDPLYKLKFLKHFT